MNKKLPAILLVMLLLVQSVMGLTALSISNAGFSSNDKDLNGDAWLVTFVLKGDQEFKGVIKAKDIKDTKEGTHALNDLSISAQGVKNSCNYDLTTSADPEVFQYGVTKENVWGKTSYESALSKCYSKGNDYGVITSEKVPFLNYDVYCLTRDKIGVPASVRSPIENFEAVLTVQAKDQIKTGKISSSGSSSVNIPPVAYAQWVGSFTTGERCPEIGAEGFIGMLDKAGQWSLIRRASYDDYRSRLNNFLDAERALENIVKSKKVLQPKDQPIIDAYINQINLVNSRAQDTQNDFTYTTPQGAKASVSGTQSVGKINIDLNRQLSTPVITMKVDADVLGIFIPVGKPEIISAKSNQFTEGANGNIVAIIKNVGSVASVFDVSVICDDPFSPSTTVRQTKNLQPNEQTTINLPVVGQTDGKSDGNCRISAYDADKPQDAVFKDVKMSVVCQPLCKGGDSRCLENSKEVCADNGCSWSEVENDGSCKKNCGLDIDCDDGNECTKDSCKSSSCKYEPISSSSCNAPLPIKQIEVNCVNKIDDDGDGKIDKKDTDCQTDCNKLRNSVAGLSLTPTWLDFNYQQCKLENSALFIFFAIGIGLIGAILIYLIGRKFFGEETETKIVLVALSLIGGALIGILFFKFVIAAIVLIALIAILTIILKVVF